MRIRHRNYLLHGPAIELAKGALIMLHGRGGTALQMLDLSADLRVENLAIFAPQADENSWYPYSFMAPERSNQPKLNEALQMVKTVLEDILSAGIPTEKIFFLGFSQGACLTLEFVCRNARRYGGIAAFTGGLIGEELNSDLYQGDFIDTPILVTTGNPDPHVPLSRVEETLTQLQTQNAKVHSKVYSARTHTITDEELRLANDRIFGKVDRA